MTLLLDINRDRTRPLRAAAERVAQMDRVREAVADLDDLIGELLDYPERMKRLNNSLGARSGELRQPARSNQARQEFADIFEAHRDILNLYRRMAEDYEAAGQRVGRLAALKTALSELDALEKEIFSRWRAFDPNASRLARDAHSRGELIPIDEVLGEYQSRPHA